MPLNLASLQSELISLFNSPPPTVAECVDKWVVAIKNYSRLIAPPSTTVDAAAETLRVQLTSIFSSGIDQAAPLEAAFTAFAATVGAGMAPAFAATPPPRPVGFSGLFAVSVPSAAAAAGNFANAINAWMLTGIAINASSGATVNWN